MRTFLRALLCVLPLLGAVQAVIACNCTSDDSVATKFQEADEVLLAMVVSGHRHGGGHDPSDLHAEEEVTFRVMYSWKGRRKPDTLVTTKTDLGLGTCGLSVDDNWHWPDYNLSTDAIPAGGLWLLFLARNEPIEITGCSGSASLTNETSTDLATLYSLAHRRPPARKHP